MNHFTQILESASLGDDRSAETLLPLVYEELRTLAAARMACQSAAHTLQPTALVHEAWLRMVKHEDQTWQNRTYFFAAASTAMRNILIDHARRKASKKRGGDRLRLDLDQLELTASAPDERMLLVEDALQQLEQVNPEWARIVVMKYFGGLNNREVASAMNISERSVKRYWAGARIWLLRQIKERT